MKDRILNVRISQPKRRKERRKSAIKILRHDAGGRRLLKAVAQLVRTRPYLGSTQQFILDAVRTRYVDVFARPFDLAVRR